LFELKASSSTQHVALFSLSFFVVLRSQLGDITATTKTEPGVHREMKVGSYGTGGRTYTTTRVKKKGDGDLRGCCTFLFVVALAIWAWFEYDITRTIAAVHDLAETTVSLPAGQEGISALVGGATGAQGRLVHLSGVAIEAKEAVVDQDFEVTFDNAATAKRVTEYCQWQEYRHETERKVGTDRNGDDIVETDVSFSYSLNWRPHLVMSMLFDNPVAYHNPQRDPVPSYTAHAEGLLGEGGELTVGKGLLRVETPQRWRIPSDMGISNTGVVNGFDRHDGEWLYSPYKKDGYAKLAHAAAAYFVDGVIDTGIEGICTPGDLRVGFEIARFPRTVSLVGTLQGSEIVQTAATNGKTLLLSGVGTKTVEELANEHVEEQEERQLYARLATAAMGVVWLLSLVFCAGKKDGKRE
jgi:Transmembrane protein 43